jgi:FkbM family methyltransferase
MDLNYSLRMIKRNLIMYSRKLVNQLGLEIIKSNDLRNLLINSDLYIKIRANEDKIVYDQLFLNTLSKNNGELEYLEELIASSYSSELHQDVMVLFLSDFRNGLYFVEFGAADGVKGSNTFLLENRFNWNGILAEPAKIWSEDLKLNRPNSNIEFDCVWSDSNSELIFNETPDAPELSTVYEYRNSDLHHNSRKQSKRYKVKTISLNDLLSKYSAPNHINYLSIDTEGTEFNILSALDWDRYSFDVITCEHNYSPQRENILNLLTIKGYKRIFESLSQYEDWYIKN